MKVFIAILVCAVAVSAHPQTGWSAPPPPPPIVDLELSGAVVLTGAGSGSAGQALQESAIGAAGASIISLNGVEAGVDQEGDVIQIANVDLTGWSPSTSTIQGVSGQNVAYADDNLAAQLHGDAVAVSNSAASAAEGQASIAAVATSENTVISKKH